MLLVTLLQNLEQSLLIPAKPWLTNGAHEDLPGLVQEIVNEADAALITPSGLVNYHTVKTLELAGFRVTPGEVDSFGWLSGVIHTSKGRLVFG